MPGVTNNPAINARRFAALLAGFDTGNGSEEEALAKGRVLRRMAADAGMRVVDAMELPDVKRAIDDQMRPTRTESPALQEALNWALDLQDELTERTRDVRKLAELLSQEEERTEELRRELTVSRTSGATASLEMKFLVAVWTASLELGLLIGVIFGGHFFEGSNGNGLGKDQGAAAGVVRENRAVPHLSTDRSVRHRLHRGGSVFGTR